VRVGIASVHETMDICFPDTVSLRQVAQLEKVLQRTVDAAVGNEPHEMYPCPLAARVRECSLDFGILRYGTVRYRTVYLHEVLIDYPAGSDVEMSHLGIAHLSFRKSHILSVGTESGMRITFLQRIEILRM